VVAGVSGSGKSTVGAALAAHLAVPFLDGDDLHTPANVAKMAAGAPLTDDDREPWLRAVGAWLASCSDGGVIACSALSRAHRDLVRSGCREAWVVQLTGDPTVIAERQASRPGHFMPTSLMASQLALLEPLAPDEPGVILDVAAPVDRLVALALGG
jgi:gluconokinase